MTNIKLQYQARTWQREAHLLQKQNRFVVLACHRRSGKSELAMMTLLDHALKATEKLSLYTYIAPLLKQSKAIMWSRMKDRCEPLRRANLIDINEGELYIKFRHNGAIIRLFGADNPDAVRGLKLNGCILDEVAQMKPELFYDIVQPA